MKQMTKMRAIAPIPSLVYAHVNNARLTTVLRKNLLRAVRTRICSRPSRRGVLISDTKRKIIA